MPAKFEDIRLAFGFVNDGGGMGENQAFVSKESGATYWHSDYADDVEELPEDIDDGEKYVQIPDKRELGLGTSLVFEFTEEFLPGDIDEVERIFSRRGAYARFKSLLAKRGALDQWYDFETKAEERALREWCEDNSIEIQD